VSTIVHDYNLYGDNTDVRTMQILPVLCVQHVVTIKHVRTVDKTIIILTAIMWVQTGHVIKAL